MHLVLAFLLACARPDAPPEPSIAAPSTPQARPADPAEDPAITAARQSMVATQLAARDIADPRVLAAMGAVPRHRFVPESSWPLAYQDGAAPIGHGQTISQPYIVAFMTQALGVQPGMRVLEIGTGSGYQAAVLSELGAQVWSIEIVEPLARWADGCLRAAGYPVVESDEGPDGPRDPALPAHRGSIHLRTGDGYRGWPEPGGAPFDRVIVTASPDHVPPALVEQLADGGRMIIPVGDDFSQQLLLIERTPEGFTERRVLPVLFVPMTGEAQK